MGRKEAETTEEAAANEKFKLIVVKKPCLLRMGFSGLGRGMWGGLWLLSVCQKLISWRTQWQARERMGSFLGKQPRTAFLLAPFRVGGVCTGSLISNVLMSQSTQLWLWQACSVCVLRLRSILSVFRVVTTHSASIVHLKTPLTICDWRNTSCLSVCRMCAGKGEGGLEASLEMSKRWACFKAGEIKMCSDAELISSELNPDYDMVAPLRPLAGILCL